MSILAAPASRPVTLRDAPAWDAAAVEALRAREYARLDALDQAYLDYTGGGLYAASQLREHQELLSARVFGNPHSTSPSSAASTALADEARAAILAWLGASPDEYVVIFTANASAALKLVGEAFPFRAGSRYLLSADDHNSVNGIREFARRRGATVTYLPLRVPELRLDDAEVRAELARPRPAAPSLFAYPAQSNYSGVQHPLAWIGAAREHGWRVLLDAAAFLPTNRLDIGRWQPDFVSISWYKLFGYPTGLGALVARREALAELERPWFAGGSIGVASVAEPRHTWAPAEAGFEDGTIDYLGIPAVTIGLRHLEGVGIETLTGRVRVLTRRLLDGLASLRHPDGSPLIRIYGPRDVTERGGTVPFNVIDPSGAVVDVPLVEARAAASRVSVRTGCFCNPGASEAARGITGDDMRRVFALGHQPTFDELRALLPGKALGAVRASVGIATVDRDLDRLFAVLATFADDSTASSRTR